MSFIVATKEVCGSARTEISAINILRCTSAVGQGTHAQQPMNGILHLKKNDLRTMERDCGVTI